jgi:hypothetical protein
MTILTSDDRPAADRLRARLAPEDRGMAEFGLWLDANSQFER